MVVSEEEAAKLFNRNIYTRVAKEEAEDQRAVTSGEEELTKMWDFSHEDRQPGLAAQVTRAMRGKPIETLTPEMRARAQRWQAAGPQPAVDQVRMGLVHRMADLVAQGVLETLLEGQLGRADLDLHRRRRVGAATTVDSTTPHLRRARTQEVHANPKVAVESITCLNHSRFDHHLTSTNVNGPDERPDFLQFARNVIDKQQVGLRIRNRIPALAQNALRRSPTTNSYT